MAELPPELLAGILASPDDDAPRLAAADWYEEAGDGERAELIRVQCQIAVMEKLTHAPRGLRALRNRSMDLVTENHDRWIHNPGSPPDPIRWNIGFQRGFPDSLAVYIPLQFEMISVRLRTLSTLDSITLRFQGPLPNNWLSSFAGMPNLRELRIGIDRTEVTWEMIEPLTVLARLRTFLIRRNDTTANLITASLRRRFNMTREQAQSTVEDEPARIAALRTRIGNTLFTTATGLDEIWIQGTPKQELKLARTLTTLRRVHAGQYHTDIHRRALAELTMIRSLSIWAAPADLPGLLSRLTALREVCIMWQNTIDQTAIGDWLIALPNLEVVQFTMMQSPRELLWSKLAQCRSLRVLHLGNATITTDALAQMNLPGLLELDHPIRIVESTHWVQHFPKLVIIHSPATTNPGLTSAYAERGILLSQSATSLESVQSWLTMRSTPVQLAHGMHLLLPDWLEKVEPATASYAKGDIESLAAWQEFGPGDEWPDLRMFAPTRIWIERIDCPQGTSRSKLGDCDWLRAPATPFFNVTWSGVKSITTESAGRVQMRFWHRAPHGGMRAIWIRKHEIIRMTAEFSHTRAIPWPMI